MTAEKIYTVKLTEDEMRMVETACIYASLRVKEYDELRDKFRTMLDSEV